MYRKNRENYFYGSKVSNSDVFSDSSNDEWEHLDADSWELHSNISDSEWVMLGTETNDIDMCSVHEKEKYDYFHDLKCEVDKIENAIVAQNSYFQGSTGDTHPQSVSRSNDNCFCPQCVTCKISISSDVQEINSKAYNTNSKTNQESELLDLDTEVYEKISSSHNSERENWDNMVRSLEFQYGLCFRKMRRSDNYVEGSFYDEKSNSSDDHHFNNKSDKVNNKSQASQWEEDISQTKEIVSSVHDTRGENWEEDDWDCKFQYGLGSRKMNRWGSRLSDLNSKIEKIKNESKALEWEEDISQTNETVSSVHHIEGENWDDDDWDWEFHYGLGFRKMKRSDSQVESSLYSGTSLSSDFNETEKASNESEEDHSENNEIVSSVYDIEGESWDVDDWDWEFHYGLGFRKMKRSDSQVESSLYSGTSLSSDFNETEKASNETEEDHSENNEIVSSVYDIEGESWDVDDWDWEFHYGLGFRKMKRSDSQVESSLYSGTSSSSDFNKKSEKASNDSELLEYEEDHSENNEIVGSVYDIERENWDDDDWEFHYGLGFRKMRRSDTYARTFSNVSRESEKTNYKSEAPRFEEDASEKNEKVSEGENWDDDDCDWEFHYGLGFRKMGRSDTYARTFSNVSSESEKTNYKSEAPRFEKDASEKNEKVSEGENWDDDDSDWEFQYGLGFRKMNRSNNYSRTSSFYNVSSISEKANYQSEPHEWEKDLSQTNEIFSSTHGIEGENWARGSLFSNVLSEIEKTNYELEANYEEDASEKNDKVSEGENWDDEDWDWEFQYGKMNRSNRYFANRVERFDKDFDGGESIQNSWIIKT